MGDLEPPLNNNHVEEDADEAPRMTTEEEGKRKQQARSISPENGVFGLEGKLWRRRKKV